MPEREARALISLWGKFLHLVFQHWFQGFAAILLALVPGQFDTLTDSSEPAGIQCAVVECE